MTFFRFLYKKITHNFSMDNTTYHIYAKNRVLYCNLDEDDFEEKWELLQVMVGLLKTDYTERDLSYINLGPKCGVGGPGKVIQKTPMWEEDSYSPLGKPPLGFLLTYYIKYTIIEMKVLKNYGKRIHC